MTILTDLLGMSPPPTEACNRIYFHQFPAQLQLMELGLRDCSFYIGQTDPSRGWVLEGRYLVRWDDNDYQKCPEKPVYLGHMDVHKDIKDHEVRALMRKYGWYKNRDGSPEMMIHPTIKDVNIGLIQVKEELTKLDAYYTEYEKSRGFSPFIDRKKSINREDDLHRVPSREVIYGLCDTVLTGLSKDDRIFITRDAHAHFSEYLISKGYTNLYTELEYKHFPKNEMAEMLGVDKVNLVSKEQLSKMRFDVIIGNPPYDDPRIKAKNNKLWMNFIKNALDLPYPKEGIYSESQLLKDGGRLSFITPVSVLNSRFGKKFLKDVSTKYNMKYINYDTNDHFDHVGVDVCSWIVDDESYSGETEVIYKGQKIKHDLKKGLPLDNGVLTSSDEGIIMSSIIKKIVNSTHPRIPLKMGQAIGEADECKNGFYDVYHSGKKIRSTNVPPDTGNNLKFVVSFSSSYKNNFTTTGYIGMLNSWCPIKDTSEGDHLSQIFEQPVIQFFVDRYKRTAGFTAAIKNSMVPMLDSFDDLYDQFKFDDKEKEYLDNHV